MTIMQGDSYPIYMELKQDGKILTPDMVEELEICVGTDGSTALRKLLSEEGALFDENSKCWYIYPTQQETLGLAVGFYYVHARIRYQGEDPEKVIGIPVGRIQIADGLSEAVI